MVRHPCVRRATLCLNCTAARGANTYNDGMRCCQAPVVQETDPVASMRCIRMVIAMLGIAVAGSAMCAPAPPSAEHSAASDARLEFVDAQQRIREHQPDLPDSAALKDYPIYAYLEGARLRRDLAAVAVPSPDTSIDAFLQAHSGEPVSRALRREWLLSLAQRGRWDLFLPRSTQVSDPALICQRLSGRLATGDSAGLAAVALARWSEAQPVPPECVTVFQWLHVQNVITPAVAFSRMRGALVAGNPSLAREFARDVPSSDAAPLLFWAHLLEAPKAALATLAANPEQRIEEDAVVAGLTRLSNADVAAAIAVLPHLLSRAGMTDALRGRLQRAVALGAAYGHDPAAVAKFDSLPAESVDGPVQEWRVRAALWAGNFAAVKRWTGAMPAELATLPRWRYWRARAIAVTDGEAAARPLFAQVAALRDYYGYLAADRLQQPYQLNERASADDAAVQATLAADPGLIRAHALFDCTLTDDAEAEWSAVIGAATPAVKVQAAHLASDWGWYAAAITTLAQAGDWDDVGLRYPRPHADTVAAASDATRVPADWLLAVMRQESLFRPDAVSRAEALGLMQMQRGTAANVAHRWHWPAPRREELFDPKVAIPLGAAYLRELLDRHDGHLGLALAAYNSGPKSVARWLPRAPMAADIWVENIPYNETRGYVQHVVEHIVAFASVRKAEPPRLTSLLPPVEGS